MARHGQNLYKLYQRLNDIRWMKQHVDHHRGRYKRQVPLFLLRFLFSAPNEFRAAKFILGLFVGFAFGWVMIKLSVSKLDVGETVRLAVAGMLLVTASLGYALSTQFRCMCWLCVPVCAGKKGRGFIIAYAVIYLLEGPMANIITNTQAALRDEFNPVEEEVEGMTEEEEEKQRSKIINADFQEQNRETEIDKLESGSDPRDKVRGRYTKKMDYRCGDIFNVAVIKCKRKFRIAELKCQSKFGAFGPVFCWPMKFDKICHIVRNVGEFFVCDAMQVDSIQSGFGEAYGEAKSSMRQVSGEFKASLQFSVVEGEEQADLLTPDYVTRKVRHDMDERVGVVRAAMTLMRRILAFMFLRVIVGAQTYVTTALRAINHDNCYVTTYFRALDSRRRLRRQTSLLPLRKQERAHLVSPWSMTLTASERKWVGTGQLRLVVHVLASVVVCGVDAVLYHLLDVVRRHAGADYHQQGVNTVKVEVSGTGFLSHLLTYLVHGLNKKRHLDIVTTNRHCLPQPTSLAPSYYAYVFALYATAFLLLRTQAYCLRLRRLVLQFFFPRREKQRVLHLYNTQLKRRRSWVHAQAQKLARRIREGQLERRMHVGEMMAEWCPHLFGWLRAKPECMVCEEVVRDGGGSVRCEKCGARYCRECWSETKGMCYRCIYDHIDDVIDQGEDVPADTDANDDTDTD